MMQFKIDENLPIEIAEVLAVAGHDAKTVYDVFSKIMPLISREPLKQHLWIVKEGRVRIRGKDIES